MRRIALSIAVAALACAGATACKKDAGGETTPDEPAGAAADAAPAGPRRTVALRWVVTRTNRTDPPLHKVELAMTDESGNVDHETIFPEVEGACTEGTGGDDIDDAILGLRCWWAGAGTQMRVVRRHAELIVLRAKVYEEDPEIYYDEHMRIDVPIDAVVQAESTGDDGSVESAGPGGDDDAR